MKNRSVSIDKMRKRREEEAKNQGGGDLWSPEFGKTWLYIHPPCRDNDEYEPTTGLPYIPIEMHYKLGGKDSSASSLDKEANPILTHPFMRELLKKRKVVLKGKECPIANALAAGELDEGDSKRQTRFLWGVTPLKFKGKGSKVAEKLTPKPAVWMCGPMAHDGIMEQFDECGDITDPDAAILVMVTKEKTGKASYNVSYAVKADTETLRSPAKLPKELVKKVEAAMKPGGDCDLFRVASNFIKSPEDLKALLGGVEYDEDDEDEEDDDDDSDDEESDDEESDDEESDDEESDDEESDDEESDDDDDSDDDDSDDEEPEPVKPKAKAKAEPKSKAKAKAKSEPEPDDDESDDDDDEDEDDEPEPVKPKSKAKGKPGLDPDKARAAFDKKDKGKASKAKAKEPEPDDESDDDDEDEDDEPAAEEDDAGLGELEEELKRLSESKKAPKKTSKAKKA